MKTMIYIALILSLLIVSIEGCNHSKQDINNIGGCPEDYTCSNPPYNSVYLRVLDAQTGSDLIADGSIDNSTVWYKDHYGDITSGISKINDKEATIYISVYPNHDKATPEGYTSTETVSLHLGDMTYDLNFEVFVRKTHCCGNYTEIKDLKVEGAEVDSGTLKIAWPPKKEEKSK